MLSFNHLALTSADHAKSGPFYDTVFGLLGYTRGYTSDRLCTWGGPGPELLVYITEGEDTAPHTHGRPGWQHGAFSVDERDTVDAVHSAVVEGGWTVVHAPREYPDYAPGYYATFVEDPDGIRWEVAHIPTAPH
ncbi:VOC family protein [Nocardia neocaledoniensis]|uniref:VOC family protein n=1 Tax=Nocardia neocaledoniensis TaxID=236511 RepID=UPI00245469CA|nr:VOC family protein [Nocardia neocaledoniensis]